METTKFYLVIDLEATCDSDERMPRDETEIIEIGAVLCEAERLSPVSEFQAFVRPGRHPKLTPFCTRLTTITQAQVDAAPRFPVVVQQLGAWLREQGVVGQFLFCSWGDYDKNQFAREERRHGLRLPLGKGHLNLKQAFCRYSGDDKKLGNGQALDRVGLRPQGIAHRGIDDARNIARLLPYCLGRLPIPPARARMR